jgi:trans-2,3-dihydro-3-hydroxyanthranilate isomerase
MARKFEIMDVFTDTKMAGNQLGVVYNSEGLDTAEMQKIAREFNFSETIFLQMSARNDCDAKVRIFTPKNELPFAGHPTVGAAIAVAAAEGLSDGDSRDLTLEENVGPVHCKVSFETGSRYAAFDLPVIAQETDTSGPTQFAASALSLELADIGLDNHKHSSFHAGLPYDLVPVKDLETIGRSKPNMQHWHAGFGSHSHNSAFVYCRETVDPENDFHARMFAPDAGIPEDPATGSAVASFAGAIAKFENLSDGHHTFRIEQGVEMGRASIITLSLVMKDGAIQSGNIGGNAVVFATGTLA